jgi:hypothetical protein
MFQYQMGNYYTVCAIISLYRMLLLRDLSYCGIGPNAYWYCLYLPQTQNKLIFCYGIVIFKINGT